ncbi:MAG: GntR family transcriptional regulator [Hyphomonadaceae bacterium]|nr:GntR family transcriptional regulator [Hyphomonadaceae bacterium]
MADASAWERAYQRLKSDILSGSIPVGPLDIRILGDRLRMSVTPVREALARLHAERLVRLAPHQGYVVTTASAQRLEHLYELSSALVHLCLERASRSRRAKIEGGRPLLLVGSYAPDLTALIADIAAAQPNAPLAESILSLNDQLYAARRCEPKLFTGANQELAGLIALWNNRNAGDLRLRLRDHHRMRLVRVDALARLLSEEAGAA